MDSTVMVTLYDLSSIVRSYPVWDEPTIANYH